MLSSSTPPVLLGRLVLVVEDDWFLADDLCQELKAEGAEVLGPVASVRAALRLLAGEGSGPAHLDLALLDVDLGDETVFPVADALATRGVPFVFTTGRLQQEMPSAYAHALHCGKPASLRAIVQALGDRAMAP